MWSDLLAPEKVFDSWVGDSSFSSKTCVCCVSLKFDDWCGFISPLAKVASHFLVQFSCLGCMNSFMGICPFKNLSLFALFCMKQWTFEVACPPFHVVLTKLMHTESTCRAGSSRGGTKDSTSPAWQAPCQDPVLWSCPRCGLVAISTSYLNSVFFLPETVHKSC